MKTIIAGGRNITDLRLVNEAVRRSKFDITEVVSGTAKGVDRLGEIWAERHGIPVKRFPADWSQGKKAGPIRNAQMAEYADQCIAVWDGGNGTRNMLGTMGRKGKPSFALMVKPKGSGWIIRDGYWWDLPAKRVGGEFTYRILFRNTERTTVVFARFENNPIDIRSFVDGGKLWYTAGRTGFPEELNRADTWLGILRKLHVNWLKV